MGSIVATALWYHSCCRHTHKAHGYKLVESRRRTVAIADSGRVLVLPYKTKQPHNIYRPSCKRQPCIARWHQRLSAARRPTFLDTSLFRKACTAGRRRSFIQGREG